ncbi:actin-binding Rho-activating protein [Coregonus clupeaformis]|uniref:actin-binding Rho-activating protein n=1 Tax=Coregonus clupeaformis TaxID=59861 RepID=UPI001E1C851F|nr:actin-binding Rho-activating protein [Coregonus clupeaformis]
MNTVKATSLARVQNLNKPDTDRYKPIMAETQTAQAGQRKPSTNKNIKKLRTICMVSRKNWVSEIEDKQAKEPVGWAPDALRELWDEPPKTPSTMKLGTWEKKVCPSQDPTAGTNIPAAQNNSSAAQQESQGSCPPSQSEGKRKTPLVPLGESRIKTKQVVKTVTSGIQERSVGITYLTERICKEAPLPGEEIDRMLSKRGSPTHLRKCSKVLERTRSWKEEKERNVPSEGEFGDGRTCSVDTEDIGYSEAEERALEAEGGQGNPGQTDSSKPGQTDSSKPGQTDTSKPGQTDSIGSSGEAKQRDNDNVSPKGKVESWVRVKRPSISVGRKELDDANKINALSKKYSAVGDLKSRWQNWSSTHTVNQKLNPFSDDFDYEYSMSLRLRKGEEGYGRPKEGTKTAERARRAEQHIHGEISDMCYVIRTMNDPDPDGKTRVTFRELFDRYVRISDKVVGILLRARKHGKVVFKGEMLWQGQDDDVIITLLV